MDVLVPERVEQYLIQYCSDSTPDHFARAIERRRDAGVVGGSVVKRSTVRIADDGARALCDEHAMSSSSGVLFKPSDAFFNRERLEIESDWRVDHIVIVNFSKSRQIRAY